MLCNTCVTPHRDNSRSELQPAARPPNNICHPELLVSQGPVTYGAGGDGKHRAVLLVEIIWWLLEPLQMTKYCGMFGKGSNTTPHSAAFPVSASRTHLEDLLLQDGAWLNLKWWHPVVSEMKTYRPRSSSPQALKEEEWFEEKSVKKKLSGALRCAI